MRVRKAWKEGVEGREKDVQGEEMLKGKEKDVLCKSIFQQENGNKGADEEVGRGHRDSLVPWKLLEEVTKARRLVTQDLGFCEQYYHNNNKKREMNQ